MRIPIIWRRKATSGNADDPMTWFPSESGRPTPKRASDPGARTIRVPSGGDLQKALDEASAGDWIELEPPATYRGSTPLATSVPALPVTIPAPLAKVAEAPLVPALPRTPLVPALPRTPLGLDTVIARRTPVFWYEAVAIVTGVIVASMTDADTEPQVPDLEGIFIDADGNITIRPGRRSAEGSAARLARTLHSLISTDGTPAALRLLISKWIASQGSVPALATELAYFSRPDPTSLIRAVYERCIAIPAVAVAPPSAPPPPAKPDTPKPQPRRSRRHLVATGLALSTAAAAAVAWVAAGSPSWAESRGLFNSSLSSLSALLPAEEGAEQPTGTDANQPSATGGRPAAPPARRAAVPAAENTVRQPLPARSATLRRETSGTRTQTPVAPTPFVGMDPLLGLGLRLSTSRELATALSSVVEVDHARVYSVDDQDIQPPSMLYPQLPPPLYAAGRGAINTMEVVVSETGSVERVRLISSPQRMTDMMLLSGAKTWKFAPASFNGEPVRYKMVVNWAATP